jgi:hypothetical protein
VDIVASAAYIGRNADTMVAGWCFAKLMVIERY